MAEVVTPIPTGALIPQEYQQQIDEARRKQMIAQMLQAQSMQNKGPQQIGPVAAKTSPLAGLANIAQAGIGGVMDANAMADASRVKSQFEKDQSVDLQKLFAAPEAQQPQIGAASIFPQNQAIARTLQTQAEKRREEGAKILSTSGETSEAMAYLNNQTPPPKRAFPQPIVSTQPDPNDPTGQRKIPFITNFDKYGRPTMSVGSAATSTINLPNKEAEVRSGNEQDALKARQSQAESAQQTLATAQRLTQALEQGAVIGGGADLKQTARKIMQAVGIDTPESGPTDLARTQFGGGMLAQINKLGRNPTDYDEKLMQKLVGSLDTDPNAAPALIAFMTAQAHKTLQDFGDFVQTKRGGQAAQMFPGLYDTADNGIRPPTELFGPQTLQFKTLEALKQAGGDITRFRDPSTGKPFAADSKFDIRASPITAPATVAPPAAVKPTIVGPNGVKMQLSDDSASWVPVK